MRILLIKKLPNYLDSLGYKRKKKKLEEQSGEPKVETGIVSKIKPPLDDNTFGWRGSKRWRKSYHTTVRRYGRDIWGTFSMRRISNKVKTRCLDGFFKLWFKLRKMFSDVSKILKTFLRKYGCVFGVLPLFFRMTVLIRPYKKALSHSWERDAKRLILFRKEFWPSYKRGRKYYSDGKLNSLLLKDTTIYGSGQSRKFKRVLRSKPWHLFNELKLEQKAAGIDIETQTRLMNRKSLLRNHFQAAKDDKAKRIVYYWKKKFVGEDDRRARRGNLKIYMPLHLMKTKECGLWNFLKLNAVSDSYSVTDSDILRKPMKKDRQVFVPFSMMDVPPATIRTPAGRRNKVKRMLVKIRLFYGNMDKHKYKRFIQKHLRITRSSDILYSLLERRLDIILVRALFFRSVFEAQSAIRGGKIAVNGTIVSIIDFVVKPLVVVSVVDHFRLDIQKRILANILDKRLIGTPPKHLIIDFRMLWIIFEPTSFSGANKLGFPMALDKNVLK